MSTELVQEKQLTIRALGQHRRRATDRIMKKLNEIMWESAVEKDEGGKLKIYSFDKPQVLDGYEIKHISGFSERGPISLFTQEVPSSGEDVREHTLHVICTWKSLCLEDLLKLEKIATELEPKTLEPQHAEDRHQNN